jgi:hypothetical protein
MQHPVDKQNVQGSILEWLTVAFTLQTCVLDRYLRMLLEAIFWVVYLIRVHEAPSQRWVSSIWMLVC